MANPTNCFDGNGHLFECSGADQQVLFYAGRTYNLANLAVDIAGNPTTGIIVVSVDAATPSDLSGSTNCFALVPNASVTFGPSVRNYNGTRTITVYYKALAGAPVLQVYAVNGGR